MSIIGDQKIPAAKFAARRLRKMGQPLNNHMRTFKQYCEDKDYMARGINMNSDPRLAKEIIWMAVGEGKGIKEISSDPMIAQYGGIAEPGSANAQRSIARILSRKGLNGPARKQIKSKMNPSHENPPWLAKEVLYRFLSEKQSPAEIAKDPQIAAGLATLMRQGNQHQMPPKPFVVVNSMLKDFGLGKSGRVQSKADISSARDQQVHHSSTYRDRYVPVSEFPRNTSKVNSSGTVARTIPQTTSGQFPQERVPVPEMPSIVPHPQKLVSPKVPNLRKKVV